MHAPQFNDTLEEILKQDPRFDREAYHFIREALDYTVKQLGKPVQGVARHISGQELLEGIRQYALQEFGPIVKTVLNSWGIHSTDDFGAIVFNLVNAGILGKTAEDRLEDFAGGYDFETVFAKPFLPSGSPATWKNSTHGPDDSLFTLGGTHE